MPEEKDLAPKDANRGFAGLNSLLSDVDSNPVASDADDKSPPSSGQAPPPSSASTTPTQPPSNAPTERNSADVDKTSPSPGDTGTGTKWFWGIGIAGLVLWALSQIDNKGSQTSSVRNSLSQSAQQATTTSPAISASNQVSTEAPTWPERESSALNDLERRALQLAPSELGSVLQAFSRLKGKDAISWNGNPAIATIWIDKLPALRKGAGTSAMVRRGLTRINIVGETIRERVAGKESEVPWLVDFKSLAASSPVQEILLTPHGACFGKEQPGCTFEIDASLRRVGFGYKELCQTKELGGWVAYYQLTHAEYEPGLIEFSYTEGSGGGSNWLKIIVSDSPTSKCGIGVKKQDCCLEAPS